MKDSIKRAQNKLVCSAERENFRTKCKKSTIITTLTAIMMMAVTPAFAQEENGFQWFHDAELLAAGDKEKSNAMTIGWGGIGTLWGRTALTAGVHSMYIGEVINAWKK